MKHTHNNNNNKKSSHTFCYALPHVNWHNSQQTTIPYLHGPSNTTRWDQDTASATSTCHKCTKRWQCYPEQWYETVPEGSHSTTGSSHQWYCLTASLFTIARVLQRRSSAWGHNRIAFYGAVYITSTYTFQHTQTHVVRLGSQPSKLPKGNPDKFIAFTLNFTPCLTLSSGTWEKGPRWSRVLRLQLTLPTVSVWITNKTQDSRQST